MSEIPSLSAAHGDCNSGPKDCSIIGDFKNHQLWWEGAKTAISSGDHFPDIPLTAGSEVWVFLYDTASACNRRFGRSERGGPVGICFLLQGPEGVKCDCHIDGGSIGDGLCYCPQENKVGRRGRTCHAPQLFQVSTRP